MMGSMGEVRTAPLTEFLTARLDEDEASIEGDWAGGDGGLHIISTAMHQRVLAEVEAKRQIVASMTDVLADPGGYYAELNIPEAAAIAQNVLRLLALPFADHPDYREEWKP